MTVEELKKAIAKLPNDMPVIGFVGEGSEIHRVMLDEVRGVTDRADGVLVFKSGEGKWRLAISLWLGE